MAHARIVGEGVPLDVLPKENDLHAGAPPKEGERQGADVVQLARPAGHNDQRSIEPFHGIGKDGEEPPAHIVDGEVLLRDAQLALRPHLADALQRRQQESDTGGLDRAQGERLLDHSIGGERVERHKGANELWHETAQIARRRGGRRLPSDAGGGGPAQRPADRARAQGARRDARARGVRRRQRPTRIGRSERARHAALPRRPGLSKRLAPRRTGRLSGHA